MQVTRVSKRERLTVHQALKFQVLTSLVFLQEQTLIPADIEILALLAQHPGIELRAFCTLAAEHLHPDADAPVLLLREQYVRNRITSLSHRKLVDKHKKTRDKTRLTLPPALGIVLPSTQPLLLDFQFLAFPTS